MLGVGWTEMLVIGVVALIVIGPKDLPQVMHRIGKFAGMIRRMGSDFQRELNKTTGLNEIHNLRQAVTAPLKATTDAIRKEFNATTASGSVQPTGAIKPADPKVESVVSAIEEKAGVTKVEPMTGALPAKSVVPPKPEPATSAADSAATAKPRRATRPKATTSAAASAKPATKRTAKPKVAAKVTAQPAIEPVAEPAPAPAAKPRAAAKPRSPKAANGSGESAASASKPATSARPKAPSRRKAATGANADKNA